MNNMQDIFFAAKTMYQPKITTTSFNLFIEPIEYVDYIGSTMYLTTEKEFIMNFFLTKHIKFFKENLSELLGEDTEISISCKETQESNGEKQFTTATTATTVHNLTLENSAPQISPSTTGTPKKTEINNEVNTDFKNSSGNDVVTPAKTKFLNKFNPDYNFETFISGPSNNLAYQSSVNIAESPGVKYNPLFIYGDSGLGKTHLVHAICMEIQKNNPTWRIEYVRGEEFTNELVNSINSRSTEDFRRKYRGADVLVVDDIQFIEGREGSQEELFNTFNVLYESQKQIVLTSDRLPSELKKLEDRLRTRFEGGVLADVQLPDYETRMAIIKTKSKMLNFNLPEDVARFMAENIKGNIRSLEGVIKKLKALKDLTHAEPTITLTKNIIEDVFKNHQPVSVTIERIIDEVARTFNVSADDIKGTQQTKNIATSRHASMYVIKSITNLSQVDIAKEFGKNHTSIIHACRNVETKMKEDSNYKETIEDIIRNIKNNQS